MMLNKALIDKMLLMPDDKLLVMLKILLSGAGIELPGKDTCEIDRKTLRKLRRVLSEITDDDIGRVTCLAEVYKHG